MIKKLLTRLLLIAVLVATQQAQAIDWSWINAGVNYGTYQDDDASVSGVGFTLGYSNQINKQNRTKLALSFLNGKDETGTTRSDVSVLGIQYMYNYPKPINKKITLWYGSGGGATLATLSDIIELDRDNVFLRKLDNKTVIDVNVSINSILTYRYNQNISTDFTVYMARSTKGLLSSFSFSLSYLI